MKKHKLSWCFLLMAGLMMLIGGFAFEARAQDELSPDAALNEEQSAAEILNYWTDEKMQAAEPMAPAMVPDEAEAGSEPFDLSLPAEDAKPGYAPGWAPGSGLPQPDSDEAYEITPDHPLYARATGQGQPQAYGVPPSNPRTGPYGPFQRHVINGKFENFPRSVHGKLFFSLGSSNFVCSGTTIARRTVLTAGHCNYGNGVFATNRLFCPSYYAQGGGEPHPTRGCWPVLNSKTAAGWVNNGDPDYDYACLIMSDNGTIKNGPIGNWTGWYGRAWNWAPVQQERAFGYPQARPFDGKRIVTVEAPEWYPFHFRSGGQQSKCTGNDMTGGSSGGSWALGYELVINFYGDTDGSSTTDPGYNWVNGVNSHKRCRTNCMSPPSNTAGVFWQEMCSPPFRKTSTGDESEDIFKVCFDNGGT